MGKPTTELNYIMDLLNIKGQQLAVLMSVDRTFVSKWKNGTRPLTPSIHHFDPAVKAILKINLEQNAKTLERFFESIIPDLDKNNKNWLEASLRSWLAGNIDYPIDNIIKTNRNSLYSANIKIFDGNKGKRNAFKEFFFYAMSLPAGQEILLSDMEDMQWLTENKRFFDYWKKMMKDIVKKGHYLYIVHNTGRDIKTISNTIFNWLPLYFSGNLVSHYYQITDYNISTPTVYVIKNHMALMSMCTCTDNNQRYSALYKDPFSVSHMERVFYKRFNNSMTLVDLYTHNAKNNEKLIKKLFALGKKMDGTYLLTQMPVFTTMKSSTLIKVLNDNNIEGAIREKIIIAHSEIHAFFIKDIEKYTCRQIYDIETLRHYVKLDSVPYIELSSIAQSPVMVKKEHVKEHIKYLFELIKNYKNFQVSLISFDKYEISRNASLWVKNSCFVYAYPQFDGNTQLLSSESSTIYSFYSKIQEHWNKIPLINKDSNWIISQLENL